jgi:glycosyltransferase involved in cell wall biosynthesis
LTGKIRVLLAIGEMTGGGSQRQLLYILERLDRARFVPQLYLVTSGGELLPEVPGDVPVHVFDRSYRPRMLRYPGQAHRARVQHLARVLHEQRIDCVYDRTYHMTLITAGAARRRPTKRVSVVVTDPARDFETNPERFRLFKRRLLRRAYQTADCVVGVSDGVRLAAIEHYGLRRENTRTIYNGFDIERIDRLMHAALPPEEAKPAGRFEIVAAGRLHPQKGFGDLLVAMHELVFRRERREVHLRILGKGPLEDELRAMVSRLELEPYVTLAGFRQNPLPYYRQADLFCLSSHYEGMPNTLVEAMLCRAPVLATDCPSGPSEVLAGGRFGRLVPTANPVALTDAIEDAICNSGKWRALTEEARRHMEQTFSLSGSISQLELLLAEVCGESG